MEKCPFIMLSKAQDVDTLGGVIFGHGHIVNKAVRGLMLHTKHQGSGASDFR